MQTLKDRIAKVGGPLCKGRRAALQRYKVRIAKVEGPPYIGRRASLQSFKDHIGKVEGLNFARRCSTTISKYLSTAMLFVSVRSCRHECAIRNKRST